MERILRVACARFLLIVLSLLVSGCNAPDKNGLGNDCGDVKVPFSLKNDSKQTVTTIPYQDLKSWIETHRKARIWSICPVDRAGYGKTNAFVIVYDEICDGGQKTPAEENPTSR